MSKYLLVLIFSGVVPFALSFYPSLKIYKNYKALIGSISLVVLIFGGWDIFAVYRGHWYFDKQSILGIYFLNLPLEEVLFFIVIPFCCIFTWEVVNYFFDR